MSVMRTTAILKTDIVDSTPRLAAQTQTEMGQAKKRHKRFVSELAVKHGGAIFSDEGDAYWMTFPSVTTAALAAVEMHQQLRMQEAGKGEKRRLSIRAVIAVGDILHQGDDFVGMAFSLTARIEKITPPDEIYLSHAAWLVLNKAEINTSFVNEYSFKGFGEPEKIYKVEQKFKTRILKDQCIIFADAKGFTQFVKTHTLDQVEDFLLDYDDLMNDICEQFGGVIRQVSGDEYFLTFPSSVDAISALETLAGACPRFYAKYATTFTVGVHKGDLNVIRSYVFGDDIHTTFYLSRFEKPAGISPDQISIVASRAFKDDFTGGSWEGKFTAIDEDTVTQENQRATLRTRGAYRLVLPPGE